MSMERFRQIRDEKRDLLQRRSAIFGLSAASPVRWIAHQCIVPRALSVHRAQPCALPGRGRGMTSLDEAAPARTNRFTPVWFPPQKTAPPYNCPEKARHLLEFVTSSKEMSSHASKIDGLTVRLISAIYAGSAGSARSSHEGTRPPGTLRSVPDCSFTACISTAQIPARPQSSRG